MTTDTTEQRFWARTHMEPMSGCWLWDGHQNHAGYGEIVKSGRDVGTRVHRYSWELHKGPIPEGICVCHRCDNPICVNPDHLFLGTVADNNADKTAKKRNGCKRGEEAGHARLTEKEVLEIRVKRAAGVLQKYVAAEYGVSQTQVWKIVHHRKWA